VGETAAQARANDQLESAHSFLHWRVVVQFSGPTRWTTTGSQNGSISDWKTCQGGHICQGTKKFLKNFSTIDLALEIANDARPRITPTPAGAGVGKRRATERTTSAAQRRRLRDFLSVPCDPEL
jgi:hypothetical protein